MIDNEKFYPLNGIEPMDNIFIPNQEKKTIEELTANTRTESYISDNFQYFADQNREYHKDTIGSTSSEFSGEYNELLVVNNDQNNTLMNSSNDGVNTQTQYQVEPVHIHSQPHLELSDKKSKECKKQAEPKQTRSPFYMFETIIALILATICNWRDGNKNFKLASTILCALGYSSYSSYSKDDSRHFKNLVWNTLKAIRKSSKKEMIRSVRKIVSNKSNDEHLKMDVIIKKITELGKTNESSNVADFLIQFITTYEKEIKEETSQISSNKLQKDNNCALLKFVKHTLIVKAKTKNDLRCNDPVVKEQMRKNEQLLDTSTKNNTVKVYYTVIPSSQK